MAISPELILSVGIGLASVLLVAGLVMNFLGRRMVVEERLGRVSETGGLITQVGDAAEISEERPSPLAEFLDRIGEGTDLFANISKNLARADLRFRPSEFLGLVVIAAIAGGTLGTLISGSIGFGLLAMLFGAAVPPIYVKRAEGKRLKAFDSQLGDMLSLVVNGLRAGYSTLMALEAVSRELPSPISDEFRRVVQEIQLGLPMDEALEHLVRRIDSDDLDMVVTAIEVQREVGGNLAVILDTISHTIRERVRIKGEISALTAQGRITAWAISLMPIGLTLLLYLINRPYIMSFFDPETRSCGLPMLIVAAIMIISGFIAVQKIVDIDI